MDKYIGLTNIYIFIYLFIDSACPHFDLANTEKELLLILVVSATFVVFRVLMKAAEMGLHYDQVA